MNFELLWIITIGSSTMYANLYVTAALGFAQTK